MESSGKMSYIYYFDKKFSVKITSVIEKESNKIALPFKLGWKSSKVGWKPWNASCKICTKLLQPAAFC